MRVEYVEDRPRRPERRGVNKTFLCLMLIILAFVVTSVLVLSRRMSDETMAFIAGAVTGGLVAMLGSVLSGGMVSRRISQLEMSLQERRVERPQAKGDGWGGPNAPVVVVTGGGQVERRIPRQEWRGLEEFEPAPREFHVVGGDRGSGRGAGGQGRGER